MSFNPQRPERFWIPHLLTACISVVPFCQSCSCQKRAKTRRWSRRVKWSRASAGSSALPSTSRPCWEVLFYPDMSSPPQQHRHPQRDLRCFSVQFCLQLPWLLLHDESKMSAIADSCTVTLRKRLDCSDFDQMEKGDIFWCCYSKWPRGESCNSS